MTEPATSAAPAQRWRRVADRTSPLLIALGALVIYSQARQLPFGGLGRPGAGLWPTVVAIITIALCAVLLVIGGGMAESITVQQLRRVVLFVLFIAAFAPVYNLLGFIPAALVVMLGLLRYVGEERWVVSVAVAIPATFAIYALFAIFLELPLRGFL